MSEASQNSQKQHKGKVEEILKPLLNLGEVAAHDHIKQRRDLEDNDRQFRAIESFYAASFTRVVALEKELHSCHSEWEKRR